MCLRTKHFQTSRGFFIRDDEARRSVSLLSNMSVSIPQES
jgi:hypothetical protein